MSDTELRPRLFKLDDIPDAVEIVRAAWAFDEMASESGRLATAAHYLIKNLSAANIGYTIETAADDNTLPAVAGFLLGHIPDLPMPGLLETDEGRRWAKNIDDLWMKQTTEREREAWARDWFTGEKLTREAARRSGRFPESPSTMLLFAVDAKLKGRGIGSALYKAFLTAHTGFNGDHALILQTDTWCGWRFYDKAGFTRLAEVPVYEDDAQGDKTDTALPPIGAFFLYGKMP